MTLSSNFGGIFAELLPGNFAKLQPPDGQDLMDGLEIKVQLGSVWKQSLTELSGSQWLWFAATSAMTMASAMAVASSNMDELAISMAVRDMIIVWKLTSDSSHPEKGENPQLECMCGWLTIGVWPATG